MKHSWIRRTLVSLLVTHLAASAAGAAQPPKTVRVACDHGESIRAELDRANNDRGLIIEFSGTCVERFLITRDDVTLRGVGDNPTIVGQVALRGSNRIRLEDFLVRDTDGPPEVFRPEGDGINILASTDVVIRRVTVQDTVRRGISVEGSTVTLADSTVLRATGVGFIAMSSYVIIDGTVRVNDGLITGVCIAMSGHVFVKAGATLIANNNLNGVLAEVSGVLTLALQTRLEANGNRNVGLGVTSGGTAIFADATMEFNNNQGIGLLVTEVSSFGPFGASNVRLDASNNGFAGILALRSSVVNVQHGTTIHNNSGPGLLIEDSRAAVQGTSITGNGLDVFVIFNGRATLGPDNQFGSGIVCDETALVGGTATCAAAAGPTSSPEALRARIDGYLKNLSSPATAPSGGF